MPFLKEFIINNYTKIILWKIIPGELYDKHLSKEEIGLLKIRKGKNSKEYFLAVRKLLENEMSRVENEELEEKDIVLKRLSKLNTFGELPYDYLVVGESGNRLIEILSLLSFYDINSSNTLIMGTSLWENFKAYDENIFEDAYFVSSKSNIKLGYDSRYQSNFDKIPNNLNYLTHDLLKLFEFIENEGDFLNAKFEGILGTTEILDNNFFSRDIYLKKYKNGKVINMGECKSMIMDI